jgi:hypothetical protein
VRFFFFFFLPFLLILPLGIPVISQFSTVSIASSFVVFPVLFAVPFLPVIWFINST